MDQKNDKDQDHQRQIEQPEADTVYTCHMHPEVVSNEPGKCPKCGMELVAKTV